MASLVFGLMHMAQGALAIVAVDVLLVMVDSVFFGIIFARSGNVIVSTIAHFLANSCAVFFLTVLR